MMGSWTEEMDALLEERLALASKTDDVVKYFKFRHLPEGTLRDTSRLFAYLAHELTVRLPRCPERTVALRKLLEGNDAGVRAALEVKS